MIIRLSLLMTLLFGQSDQLSVEEIIVAMDNNLNAKSRIMKSKMIVKGRRSTRTIESKNWVVGANKAFTEYLSPVSYTHLTLPTSQYV